MSSTQAINWHEVAQQAADILSRYIQIDTTNPPGNEDKAARYLSEVLAAEGIEAATYESAPGRANLVARLKGNGGPDASGLLLLHHMDVVPANPAAWSVPPFDGVVRDGCVWGRGAIDDKGLGAVHLMAFILLKRLGVPLSRDVILMAVADEEEGGARGADWMIQRHWPLIECEYVWDEGGTGSRGIIGNRPVFAISVSEKRSVLLHLTARGKGGHGSMASPDASGLDRLVAALHALQGYRAEIRFNAVTREFFRRVSQTQPSLAGWLMRHAEYPLIKSFMSGQIGKSPTLNAMLRDTLTATVVNTGQKANVVSEVAEAVLDARLLPDTDLQRLLDDVRRVVNDDSIAVEATASPIPSGPSPADSAMFQAMRQAIATHAPDALVTPLQTPVATDSRFFRSKGVKAYGLIPVVLTQQELGTVHGVDEKLSVEGLTLGIKIALDVILEMQSAPGTPPR